MNHDSRQPRRTDRQNRRWDIARRLVRWRRRARRWLPYATVPALMVAAVFTSTDGIEPESAGVAPEIIQPLVPRSEGVEVLQPADGLGGRESENETPTPVHIESEGDTI